MKMLKFMKYYEMLCILMDNWRKNGVNKNQWRK